MKLDAHLKNKGKLTRSNMIIPESKERSKLCSVFDLSRINMKSKTEICEPFHTSLELVREDDDD